jgi:hypothetical protein
VWYMNDQNKIIEHIINKVNELDIEG